jgi:B-cell receptor-associated protein 31
MVIFMGLVMPMPFTIKRKLFNFVSESPLVAKLQYGLKVNSFHPMLSASHTN